MLFHVLLDVLGAYLNVIAAENPSVDAISLAWSRENGKRNK